MKRKFTLVLCSALILSILFGCSKKSNTSSTNKSTATYQTEYKNIKDLPKQKSITFEFLTNNTSENRDFSSDKNYKELTTLLDNFLNTTESVDYSKLNENNISNFLNFSSKDLKASYSSDYFKDQLKKLKDDKLSIKYCKNNINSVIYDSYDNSYFIDCTCYTFVKNAPQLPDKNKYYQAKKYFYIVNEDGKWVVSYSNGYSSLRAEETPSMYMLDVTKKDDTVTSIYLTKDKLSQFKDLKNVQTTIKNFFDVYYLNDYTNLAGLKDKLLSFSTDNSKNKLSSLADKIIETTNSSKLQCKFDNVDYSFINYVKYNNSYYVTVVPMWTITHEDDSSENYKLKTYKMLHLVKKNNTWKIDQISSMSPNLTLSN